MPSTLGLLDLLSLLKKFRELLTIDTTEAGLRDWLRQLVALGEFLTELTGTEWDDDALDVLSAAVESDEVYAAIYAIIRRFLEPTPEPEPTPGPDDPDAPLPILDTEVAAITAACPDPVGLPIPWVTLISIIVKLVLWITRQDNEVDAA